MMRLVSHIITIIIALGLVQCSSDAPQRTFNFPTDSLCEGDIAFRRGNGITSDVVAYNDASGKYSHVGVIARSDSGLVVVHAVPGEGHDGRDLVRAVRLSDFFSPEKAIRGEVMRLALTDSQRAEISRRALVKASKQVVFDHTYNLSDTSKLYCTELLQLIFGHVGVDLAQGRITRINVPTMSGNYIMPSDIHQNPGLKSIYLY